MSDNFPFCAGKDGMGLSDEEFWAKVYDDGKTEAQREQEEAEWHHDMFMEFDREADDEADLSGYYIIKTMDSDDTIMRIRIPEDQCPICHAQTACGYDEMGRPWIHSLQDVD